MNSMKPVTNENGAAALEFALVLPLLLLLIFGIIEFGIILFDKAVLTNSCREGARAGIVSKSPRLTRPEINNIVDNCQDHLITFGHQAYFQKLPNLFFIIHHKYFLAGHKRLLEIIYILSKVSYFDLFIFNSYTLLSGKLHLY